MPGGQRCFIDKVGSCSGSSSLDALLAKNRPRAMRLVQEYSVALGCGSTYADVLLHNSVGVFDALLCAHKRAVIASDARLTASPSSRP